MEFVNSVREERASYEEEIARLKEALEQIASHEHARISIANIANKALGRLK
jgi:hypothetical protein